MKHLQRLHLFTLVACPLIATSLALLLDANYLTSQILFWGVPALLLTWWAPGRAGKAAVCSLVATVLGMACNLIFYLTGQWFVASSLFASRFLGIMVWEDILYFFLFFYVPILFWEHFMERQVPEPLWQRRMNYLSAGIGAFALLVIGLWTWAPHALLIPYFYLIITLLIFVVPLMLVVIYHPRLGPKLLRIGAYFAYVAVLFEITSIHLGQWHYPSVQFIGWVELFGQRFPFEEFISWIVLGAPGIIAWYEYFYDDQK